MPDEVTKQVIQASWELDRKVPLAIIFTLLVQFVLGIWYASKFDSRVNFIEAQVLVIQQNYATLNNARESQAIAQTRTEDHLEQNNQMLRALLNRSTNLHPEFQNDPKLRAPLEQ